MRITLNNRPEVFENTSRLTVAELLRMKKFTYKILLVKVNNETVASDNYADKTITEGDNVAVIHLMSGG